MLFDERMLQEQRALLHAAEVVHAPIEPFYDVIASENVDKAAGEMLIKAGRVGCLLVAGGEGTRLGFSGPKGCYPITPLKQKTLFQLFAEKVVAASVWARRDLSVAIMTSQENDKATRRFFQENNLFGLKESQLFFFVQDSLPYLDKEGNPFLKEGTNLAMGPSGNGGALHAFADSGLLALWQQQGVQYLHFMLVDNPLADPFSPALVGHLAASSPDVLIQCIEKKEPHEKVGVLVKREGKIAVLEYSEMSEEDKISQDRDGKLTYRYANISQFCFSLDFIARLAAHALPLHKAWKQTTHLGQPVFAWKFERFIFDTLAFANHVTAILFPRGECFAPLKNSDGDDSPAAVRSALQHKNAALIARLTGLPPPPFPLELAAPFYYPTPELLNKWRGRAVTSAYVLP